MPSAVQRKKSHNNHIIMKLPDVIACLKFTVVNVILS